MNLLLYLLLFGLSLTVFCSCKLDDIHKINKTQYKKARTILSNEDSTNAYTFILYDKNKFIYILPISSTPNNKKYQTYSGSYRKSSDTIYLDYLKNKRPMWLHPYLIREMSGQYLIQKFNNVNERIFFYLNLSRHHQDPFY